VEVKVGKLLTGRYGEAPEAESATLTVMECHQRLSLKPSDYVSEGAPDFFNKSYSAKGRYLVFQVDATEVQGNPVWKPGYYLLPIEAAAVLEALSKRRTAGNSERALPVQLESKETPPEQIAALARNWAASSQPLFFKCKCDHLEMRLDAPWGLRRRWKARLRCPNRCQPALSTLI
jgi:hypothetical protein